MKVNKISSSKAFVFSKSLGGKKIGGLRPPSPLVAPLRLHSGVVPGEGKGAIVPLGSMLVPRREVTSDVFGDFWHL